MVTIYNMNPTKDKNSKQTQSFPIFPSAQNNPERKKLQDLKTVFSHNFGPNVWMNFIKVTVKCVWR